MMSRETENSNPEGINQYTKGARDASKAAHEATKSGADETMSKLSKHELGATPDVQDLHNLNKSSLVSSKRGAFHAAADRHTHLAWVHDIAGEKDKADLHRKASDANMEAAKATGKTGMKHNSYASREIIIANLGTTVREVVENGKRWLVAPLSMLVEGVLNGSKGPLFYPSDEARKTIHKWDRIPITVNHPYHPTTGEPLSFNDQGVAERQQIGEVRDPKWDGKSRAEGWFDEAATRDKAPSIYNSLKAGRAIELSTGLHTDNDPTPGEHNGVAYTAIARNHRPDHLAVLPDQRGACSLDDGCGVGVTNAGGSCWQRFVDFIANTPKHPMSGKFHPQGLMPHASAQKGWADAVGEAVEEGACDCGHCAECLASNSNPNHGPDGKFSSGSDATSKALDASDNVGNNKKTNDAIERLRKAHESGQSGEKIAKHHDRIAAMHQKDADREDRDPNLGDDAQDAADAHRAAAAEHRKRTNNMKLTEPEKKTIVDALVSNSEVYDEADRPTLSAMADAKLLRLNAMFEKKKKKDGDDSEEEEEVENLTSRTAPTMVAAAAHNCAPSTPLSPTTLLSTINTVRLIDRLTAHVTDQTVKDRLVTNLAGKTDAELNDLVLMLPPVSPVANALPSLLPVFGAMPVYNTREQPTDNEQQPSPLKMEVLDYAAISKSRDKRTA